MTIGASDIRAAKSLVWLPRAALVFFDTLPLSRVSPKHAFAANGKDGTEVCLLGFRCEDISCGSI